MSVFPVLRLTASGLWVLFAFPSGMLQMEVLDEELFPSHWLRAQTASLPTPLRVSAVPRPLKTFIHVGWGTLPSRGADSHAGNSNLYGTWVWALESEPYSHSGAVPAPKEGKPSHLYPECSPCLKYGSQVSTAWDCHGDLCLINGPTPGVYTVKCSRITSYYEFPYLGASNFKHPSNSTILPTAVTSCHFKRVDTS